MIITFCGHRNFGGGKEYEKRVLDYLEARIAGQDVEFYLGGYGRFDSFALSCCKKYKLAHENARLIFVTPYITLEYQKNHLDYIAKDYDEIVYPDLERVPLKFAITYRNMYMIDTCDILVACVKCKYGGAYKTYEYALKKGKEIYNLGTI